MKRGWEPAPLRELLEVQNGFAFDAKKFNTEVGVPLIRIRDLKGGETTEAKYSGAYDPDYLVRAGDLLIGMDGEFGCYEWKGEPALLNQRVCRLRNFSDSLHPRFLYYGINKYLKEIEDATAFTTVKHLSSKSVLSIEFPHPPLPEQQRIVAKLDAAFGALCEAEGHVERNRANARELFESFLNGVFEGKEGWEEKTLGEVGKVCMCKRILKEQTTSTGDIPFYKIGTFGKEPDAYIPKEIYDEFKRKYSFPKKGDVLISASGTIGRGVVYDGEPAYFQDSNIVWIDNNEDQVLNEYLFHFYKVCEWSPTKGATISRLYNDDLRKARIAFPSLQEQRKLVAQMVELDAQTKALEATYQQKLRELEGLKKGLLGAAFRGEL